MPFLIVSENGLGDVGSARYRGTLRMPPPFVDEAGVNSEYNSLFYDYCAASEEYGGFLDMAPARRLLRLVRQYRPIERFELIQAVPEGDSIPLVGKCIGFDLCLGCYSSLLAWGLLPSESMNSMPTPVNVLGKLLLDFFRPMLNRYGLFEEASTAERCLSAIRALQYFVPNYWEDNESLARYEVLRINLVDRRRL